MKKKIFFILLFIFINISISYSIDYYVDPKHPNANDGNFCTSINNPCYTIGEAIEKARVNVPATVYIRQGIYRILDQNIQSPIFVDNASATNFLTIRNYPGDRVQLYGSYNTLGYTWELYNASRNVWRLPAYFLPNDPTAIFMDGKRVIHQGRITGNGGTRLTRHGGEHLLDEENRFTVALENGSAINKGEYNPLSNYIYLKPYDGENPNHILYEIAQKGFGIIKADYTHFEGLEIYYTRGAPVFFNKADYIVVKNNVFGHNTNLYDNAYGLRIWDSQGSLVKNNTVFDSLLWAGTSNSKGITFMIATVGDPHIVEYNHIYDIPGNFAIGTKSGVSGLIARYNYIHDIYSAFGPPRYRCRISDPTCNANNKTHPEYRPGGNWEIYNNIIINATTGVSLYLGPDNDNNIIHDNIFVKNNKGIDLWYNNSLNSTFYNNIFLDNKYAFFLEAPHGQTPSQFKYFSYNNLYYNNDKDIFWRNSGGKLSGIDYTVSEYIAAWPQYENNSFDLDPILNNQYVPLSRSPVCGSGFNGNDIGVFNCGYVYQDVYGPTRVLNLESNVTNTAIILKWDATTDDVGVIGYEVFKNGSLLTTTSQLNYIDTDLFDNARISYEVRAYDAAGNKGVFSNEEIVTIGTPPIVNKTPPSVIIQSRSNLSPKILGYYDFDTILDINNNQYVFDESVYENDGKLFNITITDTNPVSLFTGNYSQFNGVNSIITVLNNADSLDLQPPFSISFWVSPINVTNGRILGKMNTGGSFNYWFDVNSFEVSTDGLFGGIVSVPITLKSNEWQHVVGTYNGQDLIVYINGTYFDSTPLTGSIDSDDIEFIFGNRPYQLNYFNGYLDEVKIYNYSLSVNEINSQILEDLYGPNETVFTCGNNLIESGETCDGTNLSGDTCQTLGFDSGTLSCQTSCQDFDTSLCTYTNQACGNNTIEGSEKCDGTDLNGTTCQSLGFDSGTLSCKNDCSGYITSSCSYDKNTGGGNGGGGSSSFCYSCIEDINITPKCVADYKYEPWSKCINGKQSQYVEDLNTCEGDFIEERQCGGDLSEEENLLLNAKELILNNFGKKKYKASLESGYNEIFYTQEKLKDNIFLFQDEVSGQEYYGQYYDTIEDKNYYTLKRVDQGYVTILQEEGILFRNLSNNSSSEKSIMINIFMWFVILSFFGIIGYSAYYIKNNKRKKDFY